MNDYGSNPLNHVIPTLSQGDLESAVTICLSTISKLHFRPLVPQYDSPIMAVTILHFPSPLLYFQFSPLNH